jgi:hypothetical protein
MRRDDLVQAQRTTPFRPFRLHLSDGTVFDIRHPEMLMVTRHTAIVGILDNGGERGTAGERPDIERAATVDLLHVTQLEELPRPGSHTT